MSALLPAALQGFLKWLSFCMVRPQDPRLCPVYLVPGEISVRRQDVGPHGSKNGLRSLGSQGHQASSFLAM